MDEVKNLEIQLPQVLIECHFKGYQGNFWEHDRSDAEEAQDLTLGCECMCAY